MDTANSKNKKKTGTIRKRSSSRSIQESTYSKRAKAFLELHVFCPVTGERTTQIHHSAKREGGWLNLERYWIAVSSSGHRWIEDNKKIAEKYFLMVRINWTCKQELVKILDNGENHDEPIFYKLNKHTQPILDIVNNNEQGN